MASDRRLLQEMFDQFQLRKLVHGYCRAVDRATSLRCGTSTTTTPRTPTADSRRVLPTTSSSARRRPPPHPVDAAQHRHGELRDQRRQRRGRDLHHRDPTFGAEDRDVNLLVGGRHLDKYEERARHMEFHRATIVTDWAPGDDPSSVDLSHPITRDTLKALTPMIHRYAFFRSCWRDAETVT